MKDKVSTTLVKNTVYLIISSMKSHMAPNDLVAHNVNNEKSRVSENSQAEEDKMNSNSSQYKTQSLQEHHILSMWNIPRKSSILIYLLYFCHKMPQINFNTLYSFLLKYILFCLLQDIVTMMKTLVVLLPFLILYFSVKDKILVSLNLIMMKIKPPVSFLMVLHPVPTNGYTLLYLNHFLKSNSTRSFYQVTTFLDFPSLFRWIL